MTAVLIVDDSEDVRELHAEYLTQRGHDVTQAANGEEALAAIFAQRPTFVLMDLDMPVMDGWTAMRILKNDPRTEDVPIVVLTGNARPEQLAAARDAGAVWVLQKPSCFRALDAAIAHALQLASVTAQ